MKNTYHVEELGLEPCKLISGLRHSTTKLAYKEYDVERHES